MGSGALDEKAGLFRKAAACTNKTKEQQPWRQEETSPNLEEAVSSIHSKFLFDVRRSVISTVTLHVTSLRSHLLLMSRRKRKKDPVVSNEIIEAETETLADVGTSKPCPFIDHGVYW